MENRKVRLIAFAVLSVVLLAVPIWLIRGNEYVMSEGRDFKFRTAPIDPYDPFRGKYINLTFNQSRVKIDSNEHWMPGEQVFLKVRNGTDGFAEVFAPSKSSHEGVDDYLTATVRSSGLRNETMFVEFPFERYYMKETKAKEAETMYFDMIRDTTREVYAVVSVYRGETVLKSVMIDGIPIEDLVGKEPE